MGVGLRVVLRVFKMGRGFFGGKGGFFVGLGSENENLGENDESGRKPINPP